jgi:hypothetical protein
MSISLSAILTFCAAVRKGIVNLADLLKIRIQIYINEIYLLGLKNSAMNKMSIVYCTRVVKL